MLAVFEWIDHHTWAVWLVIVGAGLVAVAAYRRGA